jgi:hypothetical protein
MKKIDDETLLFGLNDCDYSKENLINSVVEYIKNILNKIYKTNLKYSYFNNQIIFHFAFIS